jgi:cyclase
MSVRVIPRLDIKGPNLVKGIHLEGLRVLGRPERFARWYTAQGADELLYMDVVASLYGRNSLLEFVAATARELFIPLTVGGGLRTLEDIKAALRAGADKVALNTAAIGRPELVREAAQRFGSSTVLVSIEAIRRADGGYEAYTDNGREATGVDAFDWARRAEDLGAGELLVTSIDREGTGRGYDTALTRRIADAVAIPVIAGGGAGSAARAVEAVAEGHADAVCMASILHYHALGQPDWTAESAAGEGNVEYLKTGRGYRKVQPASLAAIKAALREAGAACRPAIEEPAHA